MVLKLAQWELPATGYDFRSEEIKQTAFRLDGLLHPPDDDPQRPWVVNVQPPGSAGVSPALRPGWPQPQDAGRMPALPGGSERLPWVYVEVQFAPKRDFYSRLFSEIFLHLRLQQKPRPWHAVVIYPDRATER
jgi:predicted transposase YdaD